MKKYYNEPNPFADVGTKKVLIVEDDRSHRTLMDKILKSFGLVSVQAENGIQALERLQRGEKFDLIIMDWDMPELNGLDTARAIRAREKAEDLEHTPILAFTSHKSAGDREQCLAAGMDGYLHKDAWMPKWRYALRDNLEGLIKGDGNPEDLDKTADIGNNHRAAPGDDFEYPLNEFDEHSYQQTEDLLKHEIDIAIEEFLEDAEKYINSIREGLRNQDVQKAAQASHPLKSNSKSFGLLSVAHLAEAINAICERTENAQVAIKTSGMLLPKLEDAFLYGAQILKSKNTEQQKSKAAG